MVSIIIPVYKAEKTLKKCVDSCLMQSYKDIEIILVDDGSPDSCPAICDEYRKKDKRIKVYHKENGGVSSARNLGIENARGEFLLFVDSDDWLDTDMVKMLIDCQEKKDYDMVFCNHYIHANNERKLGKIELPNVGDINHIFSYILKEGRENSLRSPCGRLYRTSIIVQNKICFNNELTLGEDTLFNYEYLKFIKSIYCLNDYYGYHVFISRTEEKNKRYYQSARCIFNSRQIMFQGFLDIFTYRGIYHNYKNELMCKYIYALGIMENIAVVSGQKRKDIIEENIKVYNDPMIDDVFLFKGLPFLGLRSRLTLICYRYKLFNLLYYVYKINALRYGGPI